MAKSRQLKPEQSIHELIDTIPDLDITVIRAPDSPSFKEFASTGKPIKVTTTEESINTSLARGWISPKQADEARELLRHRPRPKRKRGRPQVSLTDRLIAELAKSKLRGEKVNLVSLARRYAPGKPAYPTERDLTYIRSRISKLRPKINAAMRLIKRQVTL